MIFFSEKKKHMTTQGGFWEGPYGVLVPNSVEHVAAKDGYNWLHKNGGETEMYITKPLTKDAWLAKFSTTDSQGRLVWKQ